MPAKTFLYYYFLFTTKYRKKFMISPVAEDVQASIDRAAADFGIQILALNVKDNHVHLIVSLRPSMSVESAARDLKSRVSREVRYKHSHLCEYKAFWGRRYFARTVSPKDLERAVEFVNGR